MSNVWHTPISIPDPFRAYPVIVIYEAGDEIEQMMSNEYRMRVGDRYVNRWCYVNDLIKENDFIHKALDVARHTIGWINQMIDERTDKQAIKIKCEYALDEITALEQKEHFADASKKIEQKE